MESRDAVRGYYDAIDGGDYDRLHALLAPGFVQERPDRTLAGRDEFVRFMRDERPRTDTEHVVETMGVSGDGKTVFARGRLLGGDGETLFGFVDVHRVGAEGIESLATYTD
ncbi:nuclear transport factor 2 family protein [Haloplanus aerogenes]|uniref:DUF4440 domain-containing protein n=1 Tax=Haloplanus aerogenes TaxID=660522 RepID=A0A3M0DRP0_9EURY|nr:nuclear transport factor 2 family protein [Haloplanus aerogenes]AZH24150.1 DUF4440 domain-containing protein [Haloplanus aerogenes]RMB24232.1 ketosteroid isomerase-like protein [Haloplanus aerogenes]